MYLVRFILFCIDAVNDFLGKNCPYIAGAIAFYTLFSLFPLILAIISVWGFLIGPDVEQSDLAGRIAEAIPVSTEFVGETVQGVASARAITGVASVLGLLWASSAAFGAIRKGINNAWGIRKTRPFLEERLIDFGLVIGAGLLMVALLFVTPILSSFQQVARFLAPDVNIDFLFSMVSWVVSPILSFGTFLVLYRFLPNTQVKFKDVWLGALVASMAFDGAKWGFVLYIRTFPVYNVVYGSVGAVMALLTWVYVSAIILLFGALATSRYQGLSANVGRDVQGIRLLWTGLTRVRLRVVESPEAG
ncbi:MAG: YihY/virulence factor BrkB family protein [Chloroflexi bacterium]|nr:YihY/virulence factor BrkB family protein [Chloroflexota bacterium]